jgi:hypothetical protein
MGLSRNQLPWPSTLVRAYAPSAGMRAPPQPCQSLALPHLAWRASTGGYYWSSNSNFGVARGSGLPTNTSWPKVGHP